MHLEHFYESTAHLAALVSTIQYPPKMLLCLSWTILSLSAKVNLTTDRIWICKTEPYIGEI